MRTFTYAAIALALVALAACKPPPPWRVYSYRDWGFAVAFRGDPTLTETPASPAEGHPHSFQAQVTEAGRDLTVAAADASGSTKSTDEILSQVPQAMAQGAGGTLKNVTYVATGKVVGREFLIEKPGAASERVRIFVANKKLYQVVAVSPLGPDDPETVGWLGSFRLLGQ